MPFGLSGATSTFQRLMHIILESENWKSCLIYIDDVIIYAKTFKEHLDRVKIVLQRLKEAGVKLSPKKCHLFKENIKFLGHVISSKGIATDKDKTSAVNNWEKPKTKDELRTFLGFCGYYRRFIEHFAEYTAPLENILTREVKAKTLIWDIRAEEVLKF